MTKQRFTDQDVRRALGTTATYVGTGAFGETWRVGDRAMKLIHQDSGVRLLREIDGLGRVTHRNVVKLLGQSQAYLDGEDRAVLEFEFVDGPDVQSRVAGGDNLPPAAAASFLRAVLSGCRALHEASILHRDLKPANIALRDGKWSDPVILDLGLVKILDMSSVTNYPALIGTAPYMAPEQLRGDRIRKAADVFSIGVVGFEALTGTHPFFAGGPVTTVSDLLAAIHAGPDEALLDAAGADTRVRTAIVQMLNAAEHRRGSTTSLLRDLED